MARLTEQEIAVLMSEAPVYILVKTLILKLNTIQWMWRQERPWRG